MHFRQDRKIRYVDSSSHVAKMSLFAGMCCSFRPRSKWSRWLVISSIVWSCLLNFQVETPTRRRSSRVNINRSNAASKRITENPYSPTLCFLTKKSLPIEDASLREPAMHSLFTIRTCPYDCRRCYSIFNAVDNSKQYAMCCIIDGYIQEVTHYTLRLTRTLYTLMKHSHTGPTIVGSWTHSAQ